LADPDLERDPEVYSDLLFRKLELVTASPDARVEALLVLEAYHEQTQFMSEAVMAKLNAAALVAEYLVRLQKMPNHFPSESPAEYFSLACPSALSEACVPIMIPDLPHFHGYCSGRYFCEYGLINLLFTTLELCKRALLYELSSKIVLLLSPIAESRKLWTILKKHFATGIVGWTFVQANSTASDRSLGKYYRVQFIDPAAESGVRNFIYRETQLANLWNVNEKLKNSSRFYSGGRPVEVINEGEELILQRLILKNIMFT
jgi:hypothetical protein